LGSELPLALKDCNAALKRAKKGTPYLRTGLGLRQHQTAPGEADIVQAKSLSPAIVEKFAHYGISP